ncbi:lecithin retinol acyltransferase family protein [uncultured Desulfovibrio sp.]
MPARREKTPPGYTHHGIYVGNGEVVRMSSPLLHTGTAR